MIGRALGLLLTGAMLASCAASAPQPAASVGPIRFAGPAKNLVLPVTELPTGTRITTEGPLTAGDLDDALTTGDPGALVALLDQHLFIAAYVRTFTVQKGAGSTADLECIVLLFPDKSGPQAVVSDRGDAMLAYGYRPISVRQTFGDSSRAVAANGVIKDPSGGQMSVTSVRILYALANVAVQISIEDEPQNVDPLDAVELANRELQYLRLSAPLAPK
ncbi:MAG: hypothetical protein E6I48_07725 [Chloroflexi bacterium]|nr:MAG: hypothetical protein E6I48_07725 [Chloroflexota bacterium]